MPARPKQLISGLIVVIVFLLGGSVAAQTKDELKVDSVEVQLQIDGKIYEGLQDRIEFSVGQVGEKVLLAQPVMVLEENKESVKTVIFKVFSKVLVGFKVDSVDLFLAQHTKIIIHLIPLPPLITRVRLNLEAPNLAPEIINFIQEISPGVEEQINRIFVGLPVASVNWSEGIFNLVVNYFLEREFPGFSGKYSLEPGTETKLDLTLTPKEPVVTEVDFKYTSPNIPTYLVRHKAKVYQDQFNILKGIPVEFLVHYQPKLEKMLAKSLNDFPELRQLGSVELGISPGVRTLIKLAVDSNSYPFKLEARYFMGERENFGNFQGYLGYSTEEYELFTRCYLGNNPTGLIKVGLKLPMSHNLTGGFEYEIEHRYKNFWFRYQFERGDYLDLRWMIEGKPNEALIGIYINDHANLELVDYDNNFGVQVMFHF